MPTLYSVYVVEWKEVAGPPRTVEFVRANSHEVLLPDGVNLNEGHAINQYIRAKGGAKKDELYALWERGLVTLATAASVKLTPPTVRA